MYNRACFDFAISLALHPENPAGPDTGPHGPSGTCRPVADRGHRAGEERHMNWIRWAVIAVVVSLGQAGLAQAGCDGWNTPGFFEGADGDLVQTCLAKGADPNARAENGDTPLHKAARKGRTEAIAALLNAGADHNARDEDGRTPLHIAALFGRTQAIAALLDAGADHNARDENGWTPLHIAALLGQTEDIAALIDAGADPSALATEGITPLHSAAHQGQTEAIAALLDAGADPNARAENGDTPFDLIPENSPVVGTSAYWRLNDARFD